MDEVERKHVLHQWNNTHRVFPASQTFPELVDEQAKKTPHRIAVKAGSQSLTYADLVGRANQLARYLRTLGVSRESLVALCVARSLDLVVGLLGILKIGGCLRAA